MTVEEVASSCGFSVPDAALAKAREYDEPFVILDDARAPDLLSAIKEQGLRWTRGGRFSSRVRQQRQTGSGDCPGPA